MPYSYSWELSSDDQMSSSSSRYSLSPSTEGGSYDRSSYYEGLEESEHDTMLVSTGGSEESEDDTMSLSTQGSAAEHQGSSDDQVEEAIILNNPASIVVGVEGKTEGHVNGPPSPPLVVPHGPPSSPPGFTVPGEENGLIQPLNGHHQPPVANGPTTSNGHIQPPSDKVPSVFALVEGHVRTYIVVAKSDNHLDYGVTYVIRADAQLRLIYNDYAARLGIEATQFRVYLAQRHLLPTETPLQAGLHTGDTLKVVGHVVQD